MSKIAKKPIVIPSGVDLTQSGLVVSVKGPKGTLEFTLPERVKVVASEGKVQVTAADEFSTNLSGMTRSILANMVTGVSTGWSKTLELTGTGYRANVAGDSLQLALGFSHPVVVKAPTGVTFEVKDTKITIKGADRVIVGEVAAKIRAWKPADPYKIKGLKYEGEVIIKKAGKAAKAGGTASK
ncbi:MAG: 50S ribosomal protein L6 [Patescibacteria group bacterium]